VITPETISHEELMALPVLQYTGPIHVVTTAAQLEHAIADVRREHVLGFDTEKRPSFQKGQNHAPSLVQFATDRAAYLFQLAQLDGASVLTGIFENPKIVKTGIALVRDLIELQALFPFEARNVVDLGDAVARHGFKQTGLRNLAGMFLRGRITKGARTTNWANHKLTASQIRYAATDAWVCRELYLRFDKLGLLKPKTQALNPKPQTNPKSQ
jgi:ribonuclease D